MKKIIVLTLFFLLGFTCFAVAEEVIELEVGSGALDEYKSVILDGNDYKSDDPDIAYVEGDKLIAKDVGETYIKNENKEIRVIVYYVGDELVPVEGLQNIGSLSSVYNNLIYIFFTILYFIF